MNNKPFTMADAFQIQKNNVRKWSKVLNHKAYCLLLDKVLLATHAVIDEKGAEMTPWDVPRGQDIDMMVHNIALTIDL